MASKAVINNSSALSWNTNRTLLAQEVLRVLINCNKLLIWEKVKQHVNEVVLRIQYSGNNKKLRNEVVGRRTTNVQVQKLEEGRTLTGNGKKKAG